MPSLISIAPPPGAAPGDGQRCAPSPFTAPPDPRFLYGSASHNGALRAIGQAVARKDGIIVLTGRRGTGKTLICRALPEQLGSSTFTAVVRAPASFEALLQSALVNFGIVSGDAVSSGRLAATTRYQLLGALHDFLLSLMAIGSTGVLIVDEAHTIPSQVLEQIRVLSNLEGTDGRLLQIVMVGEPALLAAMGVHSAEARTRRIASSIELTSLTPVEVEPYIQHRLVAAGAPAGLTFDDDGMALIRDITRGVPATIDTLCDRALTIAAGRGSRRIRSRHVMDAAVALNLAGVQRSPRISRGALAIGATAMVLLTLTALFAPLHKLIAITTPRVPPRPTLRRARPFERPAAPESVIPLVTTQSQRAGPVAPAD